MTTGENMFSILKNLICYGLMPCLILAVLLSCSSTHQERDAAVKETARNTNGRNDAWGYMGAGGGGAMFYPAVSPFDPDHVFVSCDMTGAYVTYDGGRRWRMFNLRGVVKQFVFDPRQRDVVYANAAALFRSVDGGNTWRVVYPHARDIKGTISVGDHASEVIITHDSINRRVITLAIDPGDSKKLYAVMRVGKEIGFYNSIDWGDTWQKEKVLTESMKNIFVVPSSPGNDRTLYITGSHSVMVRESGQWKINNGPDGVDKLTEFAGGFDAERNKFILYAISGKSYFDPQGRASGIYITEDGGKTWENREGGLAGMRMKEADMPEWRSVATSAAHPNVVYISYGNLKVHADTVCLGVAKSEDYGKTWTLAWKDIAGKAESPSPNLDGGWIDERFGPQWGDHPFSIGVAPGDPAICYTTDFGRTIKTADGGNSWRQVYTEKGVSGWRSRGLEVTTSYSVVSDPFDTSHLFITTTDIGLMESRDGGKYWRSATDRNGIPRAWHNSTYWLVCDPAVKNKMWAAMSGTHDLPRPKMWRSKGIAGYKGGVVLSEDGGRSWVPVSKDIGEAAVTHLLLDTATDPDARTIYACAFGKGVYKSMDGGRTWRKKNNGLAGAEPFAWRIEKRNHDGALFLIVARRSEDETIGTDLDGALYKSVDGAESWSKIPLPKGTNGPMSVLVDPRNEQRLLISAWGRKSADSYTPDTGGGIFLSDDDGRSWLPVLTRDQHIHDLTADVRNNVLYACGFNSSAYRSEDSGKTWERIQGYNFKWGKRVDPDLRDPEKIFIITFGGGVWHGPAKGDPNAVEDITDAAISF